MKDYFLARYAGSPTIAVGFHGCKQSVAQKVLHHGEDIRDSNNDLDWLGTGKYFWESNPQRALEWAEERYKGEHDGPAVIGALIDLSCCLNLLDASGLRQLKIVHALLKKTTDTAGSSLPENVGGSDRLQRKLDCLVVNRVCALRKEDDTLPDYTTVRGVFWEGDALYANAGFKEKNHIQICVRDTRAVLCYFHPRCYPELNVTAAIPA